MVQKDIFFLGIGNLGVLQERQIWFRRLSMSLWSLF